MITLIVIIIISLCVFSHVLINLDQITELDSKLIESNNRLYILNNKEINYFKKYSLSNAKNVNHSCTMLNCFNLSKCDVNNFKIYLYQNPVAIKSEIYKKIIQLFNQSKYLTHNPHEACLFITSLDTLDRDKISPNYIDNLEGLIKELKYWNNGENHLIFNLYSGSWPSYAEILDFNSSKAILVKASFSIKSYRIGYDISFPLFHQEMPYNNSFKETNQVLNKLIFAQKKYFLTFKGKRYLNGIGSETRNSLFHLNNNRDIILITTCKHGSNWQEFKDDRCDLDNALYEKYDYKDLLYNSEFCLIPRGRRLGTYRFLEALKAGCIPVILSNNWILPFSEIINWKKAVIWADERHLTQFTSVLRDIPQKRIKKMRNFCILYYENYFSSIDRIIETTVEIIKARIMSYSVKNT